MRYHYGLRNRVGQPSAHCEILRAGSQGEAAHALGTVTIAGWSGSTALGGHPGSFTGAAAGQHITSHGRNAKAGLGVGQSDVVVTVGGFLSGRGFFDAS